MSRKKQLDTIRATAREERRRRHEAIASGPLPKIAQTDGDMPFVSRIWRRPTIECCVNCRRLYRSTEMKTAEVCERCYYSDGKGGQSNSESEIGSGKSAPVEAGAGIKNRGPAQTGQLSLAITI